MCEVAFSLALVQHKPNNTTASIIHNMQHQLSLIGPVKDKMKISLNYIGSEMAHLGEWNSAKGRKRKIPPKQIARSKKGRFIFVTNIIKAARNSPQERPPVNNKVKN